MKINYNKLSVNPLNVNKETAETKGPVSEIVDKFMSTGKKIDEYTKPRFDAEKRIDTSGNRGYASVGRAAAGGSLFAFLTGGGLADPVAGLIAVPAGAIGGIAGVKAGEKTQSIFAAVATGALTGAAIGGATGAIIAGPAGIVNSAISGAFNGATATLYGSSKAATRDGVIGGGVVASLLIGGPGALVGSVAGGVGGSAVDDVGRAVLGTAAGAVIGGAIGAMSGPSGILLGALKGGISGGAGAVIGPRMMQGVRNLGDDLDGYLAKKTDPLVKNVRVKRWQKVALGAGAIALPTAFSAGITIGGPVAITAGALIGGVMGAKAMMEHCKHQDEMKKAQNNPAPPVSSPVTESSGHKEVVE